MAKKRKSGRKRRLVRAGGGVVFREHESKGLQVLAVHRPKYDDWSLPKGKLEAGEGWKRGALREVREETGLRCLLGPELKPSRYRVGRSRKPKVVRWWVMAGDSGKFKPSREVDEIMWIKVGKAAKSLDYKDDRRLVREAAEAVAEKGLPG